jgi:hypothetical protein
LLLKRTAVRSGVTEQGQQQVEAVAAVILMGTLVSSNNNSHLAEGKRRGALRGTDRLLLYYSRVSYFE